MKSISTKKIYAYIIFSRLKATPPKEYPDTNEMVETVDNILPAFEKVSGEFMDFRKQADDINSAVSAGRMQAPDAQEKLGQMQKEVRAFELDHADELVTVELETAAFTALMQQFERWGKNWFDRVEDFVSVSKDLKKVQ